MEQFSEEKKYWAWMESMPEVTPKAFYSILDMFGSAQGFFNAAEAGSDILEKLPEKIADSAKAAASKQRFAEVNTELIRKGISVVTRLDEDYPALLAGIKYPPPVLFVKGSLSDIGECISIVGTRKPTRHAVSLTRKIAAGLCELGFCVVSGMAYGIDTAAHEGALEAGGKTIAVLGCGADVIYPRDNKELYHSITQSGAVISELPLSSRPYYANFPARNRIITGLSAGTLIVESEEKGGTAISAKLAVSQGRNVFAVPGMGDMSALPNLLIKQGAAAVTCAEEILEFYGNNTKKIETRGKQTQIQLDFLQRHIYNLLLKGDLSVESIAQNIDYTPGEVMEALTMLELGQLIKRLPGGKYGVINA